METVVQDYSSIMAYHKRTELNPGGVYSNKYLPSPVVRIEDHNSEVMCCEFHSAGGYLLSGNQDGQIHICATDGTWPLLVKMKGHTGEVMEAHFSSNGSEIYSCSADTTLGVWDPTVGLRRGTLEGHLRGVNCVQRPRVHYSVLCSGSQDSTVRIWDVRNEECVVVLLNEAEVNATCFNGNAEYAFSGGLHNDIKVWDLRMTEVIATLEGHTGSITGLSLSPCGSYLLSHSIDNILRIWDVRPCTSGDRCLAAFPSNNFFVSGLLRCTWSPDGRMVSAGTAEHDVLIWDAESGKEIYSLPAHENSVNDVAFHPTQPIVASAANDNYLCLHELYN